MRIGSILLVLAGLACAGCGPPLYLPLPENPTTLVMKKPAGDCKTYSWHAVSDELRTYWGRQRFKIQAASIFPDNWREPGDECWEVKATNQEKKNVPFQGVLYRYKDRDGKDRVEARPPFGVEKTPDGLYIFIETHAEVGPDGKIVKIRPQVHVREIRSGGTNTSAGFTPYWVEWPLIPDQPSEITPAPPEKPPEKGTQMPN